MCFSYFKGVLFFFILFCLMMGISCSGMVAGSEDETSGIIPYPKVPSIVPLAKGNHYFYEHTTYNSSGEIIKKGELSLKTDRVYGLKDDSALILLTQYNYNLKFIEYVFEYEWNNSSMGNLISYRDTNVDTLGIYFRGEYQGENRTLYKAPILWLKYPGKKGDTWQRKKSDSTIIFCELVDTNATMYIPTNKNFNISGLEFLSCYLYKEINGNITSYYYYNTGYGQVGFLEYIDDILNRTVFLKNYFLI